MYLIEDTVITSDISQEFFVCDLSKCKGACCIEGDLGAPLETDSKRKLVYVALTRAKKDAALLLI